MCMRKSVYDKIKRQNGEAFAKAIRNFDNGIFDIPNLVDMLKYAGRNALPLLDYLESLKEIEVKVDAKVEDPFVLLDRAGYKAFYADSLEKQNSITNYYEKDELLCTFKDADRYKRYHIIHAIKKNVHEIKRENFRGIEQREDEYGTSVISIQILKAGGFISIKNRYNHTVNACDNTFYSNPDRIIEGLSLALRKYFHVDFAAKRHVFLPSDYIFVNGKILKYDIEKNNVYIGDGFYCKDGYIHIIDKNSQLQIDTLILDLRTKEILNPTNEDSSLLKILRQEIEGETLQVLHQNGVVALFCKQGEILTLKDRQLQRITLRKVETLPEKAFYKHPTLQEVNALSVQSCLQEVLAYCLKLKKVSFEKLKQFHSSLFEGSNCLVQAPLLENQGVRFFGSVAFDMNKKKFLTEGLFSAALLKLLENDLLFKNITYQQKRDEFVALREGETCFKFKGDKLLEMTVFVQGEFKKEWVIRDLADLEILKVPNVTAFADNNIECCPRLKKVYLPKVQILGDGCVSNCNELEEIFAPNLEYVGNYSFSHNNMLKKIDLPKLKEVKNAACFSFSGYEEINVPQLVRAGYAFCKENPYLKKIYMPMLKCIAEFSFMGLKSLEEIDLPQLQYIEGRCVVLGNPKLKRASFNKLMNFPSAILKNCPLLEVVEAEALYSIDRGCLNNHPNLREIYAPNIYLPKCDCLNIKFIKKHLKRTNAPLPTCYYLDKQVYSLIEKQENERG